MKSLVKRIKQIMRCRNSVGGWFALHCNLKDV